MEIDRVTARLARPTSPAALAAFRIFFGLLMAFAAIRFWLKGWIESLYIEPQFHFKYAWFPWVDVLPSFWLHGVFILMVISALLIAAGAYTRTAAAVFFTAFVYTELIDKTTYLNHYYLVSLVAFLLIWLPSDRLWALKPAHPSKTSIPAGAYTVLRWQFGLVYFFAGVAKLNADWLLRGEPLGTWLKGFSHLPFLGSILANDSIAIVMSWGGAVFDLTIWMWLLSGRLRWLAVMMAVGFHLTVGVLFPIGIFPWVMLLGVSLFLPPEWPRQFLSRWTQKSVTPMDTSQRHTVSRLWLIAAVIWVTAQVAIPLRHLGYEGPVNWTEQGFRFSWRVMLIEKTGTLDYRIETEQPRASYRVNPRDSLTPLQFKMLVTQPDMIADYARHLDETFRAKGYGDVRVFADSFVSFNGRLSQRYVDHTIDLSEETEQHGHIVVPLEVIKWSE